MSSNNKSKKKSSLSRRDESNKTKRKTLSEEKIELTHNTKWIENLRNAFTHDTLKFICGIALLGIILFCFISCISFIFTGAADQSLVLNKEESQSLLQSEAKNTFAILGASLSQTLVDGFLGIGIFPLLIFPILLSLKMIGIPVKGYLTKAFVQYTLLALSISLLAYLLSLPFADSISFRWGGKHGEFIGEKLQLYIGIWGIILLLIILFIICWVLFQAKRKDNVRKALSFSWIKRKKRNKNEKETFSTEEENLEKYSSSKEEFEDNVSYANTKEEEQLNNETEDADLDYLEQISDSSKKDKSIEINAPALNTQSKLVVELAEGGKQDENIGKDSIDYVRDSAEQGDLPYYIFPKLDILDEDNADLEMPDMEEIRANEQLIIDTLESFKIKVTPIKATVGPTVTLYEIEPDAGIKISRIRNLEDDIALGLKADGIRIIAPIPGKGTIGIEVPNTKPKVVGLRSLLASRKFIETKFQLPIALGRTITNEVFTFDLAKMPHLLIAGATGQGKSVGMNVIITSLLYAKHPSELKFVMIDPKILEFSIYNELEHHFFARIPSENKCIITDTDRVVPTLLSLCQEMDNRYLLLTSAKVRNIAEYNTALKNGELDEAEGHKIMPYIVLVVDEFADLIMTGGKEIERPIARLAQKARAAGIHMILATQRPTTDVVTGTIKANFPARIAFKVFSAVDSRTILDSTGANRLIGRGDMLFYQGRDMIRIQCALVDTPETQRLVDYIAQQPGYSEPYPLPEPQEEDSTPVASIGTEKFDVLFEEVARAVVASGQGSTSKIQRDFEIGFNRAGRLMDQLEKAGIVGKQYGSKPRDVLVQDLETLNNILYNIRLSTK